MEWWLLKRLPLACVICVLLVTLAWGVTYAIPPELSPVELNAYFRRMDFVALGVLIVLATAIFTVAIGCVIVVIMKGPAYVADGYPLSDRDSPRP